MTRSLFSVLSASFLLFSATSAINFQCDNVVVDGIQFDFSKLDGPHAVSVIQDEYPTIYNTTWTVDLCKRLPVNNTIPQAYRCESGTQVCGIKRAYSEVDEPGRQNGKVESVFSIAGNYIGNSGRGLDPHLERLKGKEGNLEGLEVVLNGGVNHVNKKQQAIIRLICDHQKTGDEGNQYVVTALSTRDDKTVVSNASLSYVSYNVDGAVDILRLDWKTMHACEDAVRKEKGESKGSWGFFTWVILLAFLGTAAYLIFGSWLNYNRYGARGWDLLPHGDTIRDIPYLFKDWSRKVVDTVSGSGSRGGYSAV